MFDVDASLALGLPHLDVRKRRPDQLIPRVEHTEMAQVTVEQPADGDDIEIESGRHQRGRVAPTGLTESIAARAALRGLAP